MYLITKTQWFGLITVLCLMLLSVVSPDAAAYIPAKPNIDLGEIVNQKDSLDKTIGKLVGYGIMFVGLMIGIGSLIGMGYAMYNTIMRLIDENDKFDIKNAVVLIFVVSVIGIAGIAIAFMVFNQGLAMRGK